MDFYTIVRLTFHPQHELKPKFGGVLVVAARIPDLYLLQISRWSNCYAHKVYFNSMKALTVQNVMAKIDLIILPKSAREIIPTNKA